jgi:hypothetical protein
MHRPWVESTTLKKRRRMKRRYIRVKGPLNTMA